MAAKRANSSSTRPKTGKSHRPTPGTASKAENANEEEIGKLLAHCAKLERQIIDLKQAREDAKLDIADKQSERPMPQKSPSMMPPAEAMATLREGLGAMREVLIAAAAQVDAFAKKEFDLFDPKAKPLMLLRTSLLKAAGLNAKVPPPVPVSLAPRAFIDITDLAEALESLRPGAGSHAADIEVLTFPAPPKFNLPTD
jgi:hypothetical protein